MDNLSDEESFRARVLMVITLRRFENVFFQYTEGLIDDTALGNYGFQRTWTYNSVRSKDFAKDIYGNGCLKYPI